MERSNKGATCAYLNAVWWNFQCYGPTSATFLTFNRRIFLTVKVNFILGSILYGAAYTIINYFKRPIVPGEEGMNN